MAQDDEAPAMFTADVSDLEAIRCAQNCTKSQKAMLKLVKADMQAHGNKGARAHSKR